MALPIPIGDRNDVNTAHALEMDDPSHGFASSVQMLMMQSMTSLSSTSPYGSAVYRWYDIDEPVEGKRGDESYVAKCKICRQEGKLERKAAVRFNKSVTSNLWRHLKENHPLIYAKQAKEKKSIHMHRIVGAKKQGRKRKAAMRDSDPAGLDPHVDNDDESGMNSQTGKLGIPNVDHDDSSLLSGTVIDKGSRSSRTHVLTNVVLHESKIRAAISYFCLYELLPVEVFARPAFRNLLMEVINGTSHIGNEQQLSNGNDTQLASICRPEALVDEMNKMVQQVKERTWMQVKSVDVMTHLMVSEWPSSTMEFLGADAQDVTFVGLYAVGLDADFYSYRHCLSVISLEQSNGSSIAKDLAEHADLMAVMKKIQLCNAMPQILGLEPRSGAAYQTFCQQYNLFSWESVTSTLQQLMLCAIDDIRVTDCYTRGNNLFANLPRIVYPHLDDGMFMETSELQEAEKDTVQNGEEIEASTSLLNEFSCCCTGHVHRDLLFKVLYLFAHIKRSCRTRNVLKKIAADELGMDTETFAKVYENTLNEIVVCMSSIYHVLELAVKMKVVLLRYFSHHEHSPSDFSNLVQLVTISPNEWARVEYLKTILRPFAEATVKLHAERYAVASLIIPSIYTLLEKLREITPSSDEFQDLDVPNTNVLDGIIALRDVAYSNLYASFGYLFRQPEPDWNEHKRETFNLLWSATLLDPRTRSFIIKGPLSQNEFWELVKNEAAKLAGQSMTCNEKVHELITSATITADKHPIVDGSNTALKSGDLWDDLQANLASCAQDKVLLSSSKSSLEMIKSSNLLEIEVTFFQEEARIALRANPLEWWRNMRLKYPLLARFARYVLSIPGNVKVDENPVSSHCGFVTRAHGHMSKAQYCGIICASMNLRTEKNVSCAAGSSQQMWMTV